MDTSSGAFNIEDELWRAEIKEELFPTLMEGFPHMRWLTDGFPTGDTLTIPTTGRMAVRDYTEGDEITVEDPSLNEIQLVIDKYYQAGIGVTDKYKQDSYIGLMSIAGWRRDMIRGLKEKLEADVLNTVHTDPVNGHTFGDNNVLDGYDHRWAASGTANVFDFDDFRHAKLVFDKANVSKSERIFTIDPKVSYDLLGMTASNAGEVLRQDVYGQNTFIKEGFGTGTLIGRFYGFWVFETNLLPTVDSETIDEFGGSTSASLTSPVVNQAFGSEALFGAFRQNIEIEQFRDYYKKRDVSSACVRYGTRVFRPESLIAVLSV